MHNSEHGVQISVIIISYNTRELTLKCLESVHSQRNINLEVLLVDNASKDNSVSLIEQKFPLVKLIRNHENLGFAKANNQAIRQAAGEFILLFNSDAILPNPDALSELYDFMNRRQEIGIGAVKIVKGNGVLDWPCKRSFQTPSVFFYRALKLDKFFPNSPRFGKYHLTYLSEDAEHEIDATTGAFMLIRRKVIEDIGLLDEHIFMYSEDMDFCFRAKQAGWKVIYNPRVQVIHYKSESSKKHSFRMIYWWYYSTWYVYKKHMAANYHFLINQSVYWGFFIMFIFSLLSNSLKRNQALPSRR